LYDPRKQVRDQGPDGEFVGGWVPELAPLPAAHLDASEKTPLAVRREVGVRIGEDYPHPVANYERARLEFRERDGAVHGAAAARLGDEEIARRSRGDSGSRGRSGADRGEPAEADGDDHDATSRTGLDEFG